MGSKTQDQENFYYCLLHINSGGQLLYSITVISVQVLMSFFQSRGTIHTHTYVCPKLARIYACNLYHILNK